MDKIDQHDKKQAMEEIKKNQRQMYQTGKVIVFSIATLNIIMAIVSFFLNYNLITLLVQIALSVALYSGVTWIRYLFAVGAALGSILTLYTLLGGSLSPDTPAAAIIFLVLYLIYEIFSTIVLFASKGVSEFLYVQKNG